LKIKKIAELLNTAIVSGENFLDREVEFAFASDLMSDVLTVEKRNIVLLTGLANIQTIRTAEMSDVQIVVLARNKKASPEMIKIASDIDLVLMEYNGSLFKASGILFNAGIRPVF